MENAPGIRIRVKKKYETLGRCLAETVKFFQCGESAHGVGQASIQNNGRIHQMDGMSSGNLVGPRPAATTISRLNKSIDRDTIDRNFD